MNIVEVVHLISRYKLFSGEKEASKEVTVLDDISLSIKKGDFVGILGHNGSGKTTLARQLVALLKPAGGAVYIKGMNTADDNLKIELRKTAGIVFQNPDNQIIGATVEEDVAFGMENLGIPEREMDKRIEKVLESLGMSAYRMASPHSLSGGQKQKVALSGILAMQPECIVFDEPTAMLDPAGRKEVIDAVHFLNQKKGITVIYITHHTSEVEDADFLYLMKEGKIKLSGPPQEVWNRPDSLEECGVGMPFLKHLLWRLKSSGIEEFANIDMTMTEEDLLSFLAETVDANVNHNIESATSLVRDVTKPNRDKNNVPKFNCDNNNYSKLDLDKNIYTENQEVRAEGLFLDRVSYSYYKDNPDKNGYALKDITLSIGKGEYVAIAGETGSGKSTLLTHLNGLIFPTEGSYYFGGREIKKKDPFLKTLRQKVGFCFQYPDHQLFEETVLKDIAFGPSNMGYDKEKSMEMARKAMDLVGLPASLENISPFTLSGGQKKRIAISGILAMEPEYLVLDEPAAGLDKEGKDRLFALLKDLHDKENITIILVSHDMDEVATHASRLILLKDGKCIADGPISEIFTNKNLIDAAGLSQPESLRFYNKLCQRTGIVTGFVTGRIPMTMDDLVRAIIAERREDD